MITKYIKGDITETELNHIAHGVNCSNVMNAGVAKAIFKKFPEVKIQYHKVGDPVGYKELLLGKTAIVRTQKKVIYNLFTQLNYGNAYKNGKRYVNYGAIVQCFNRLIVEIKPGEILAIPKIGCGLAGGNWEFVEQLINDTVGDNLEIWVYEL